MALDHRHLVSQNPQINPDETRKVSQVNVSQEYTRKRRPPGAHCVLDEDHLSRLSRGPDFSSGEAFRAFELTEILITGDEDVPIRMIVGPIHLAITEGISPLLPCSAPDLFDRQPCLLSIVWPGERNAWKQGLVDLAFSDDHFIARPQSMVEETDVGVSDPLNDGEPSKSQLRDTFGELSEVADIPITALPLRSTDRREGNFDCPLYVSRGQRPDICRSAPAFIEIDEAVRIQSESEQGLPRMTDAGAPTLVPLRDDHGHGNRGICGPSNERAITFPALAYP